MKEVNSMFDIRKIQEQVIYGAVKAASNDETAAAVVSGENGRASGEGDADWVKSTMKRLEDSFDKDTVKQIRANCQCGYAMDEKLALVNELLAGSSTLEEFVNQPKAKAAGLSGEDGQLYLSFQFCPCPMLAEVDKLDSYTWCECTKGYSKVLFEKAFGCEVEVELLKSIKAGDDVCLMRIMPQEAIWK